MPKLYVANCTPQRQIFMYRLDFVDSESSDVRLRKRPAQQVRIEPGKQSTVGGELKHAMQAEEIIHQIDPFGAVPVEEALRTKTYSPYVYALDKPIPKAVIDQVVQRNKEVKFEEGETRRRSASVAANAAVLNQTNESLNTFQVAVEQVDDSPNGGSKIDTGYTVRQEHQRARGAGGRFQRA